VRIELWSLDGTEPTLLTSAKTNADGRPESPLLTVDEMKPGHYEILFFVGDYFAAKSPTLPKIRFLDKVPVRLGIADAGASYHVPLYCSPWSYSTHRSS
jgi:5-hydroxyisourate hydrolase